MLQLFPNWDWKQAASRIAARQAVAGMTGDAERAKRAKVEGTPEQAGVSAAASAEQQSQDASSPSTSALTHPPWHTHMLQQEGRVSSTWQAQSCTSCLCANIQSSRQREVALQNAHTAWPGCECDMLRRASTE